MERNSHADFVLRSLPKGHPLKFRTASKVRLLGFVRRKASMLALVVSVRVPATRVRTVFAAVDNTAFFGSYPRQSAFDRRLKCSRFDGLQHHVARQVHVRQIPLRGLKTLVTE
jgi:hypothetical protein